MSNPCHEALKALEEFALSDFKTMPPELFKQIHRALEVGSHDNHLLERVADECEREMPGVDLLNKVQAAVHKDRK